MFLSTTIYKAKVTDARGDALLALVFYVVVDPVADQVAELVSDPVVDPVAELVAVSVVDFVCTKRR